MAPSATPHSQCNDWPDQTDWDCIVIGAGPAGSTAALQLGRRGHSVLLIDKKKFPRSKVCGGCLSGKAIDLIRQLDLSDVLDGAIPLRKFVLGSRGQRIHLDCRGGMAISRRTLDQRLRQESQRQRVSCLTETTGFLGETTSSHRVVDINRNGRKARLRARLVLVCSGLSHPDRRQTVPLREHVNPQSRIGLTASIPASDSLECGTIYMGVAREGYLGITTLEDGSLNLSACVNPATIRSRQSPRFFARRIMEMLELQPPPELAAARWLGTPRLTRRLDVPGGERVFVLGDAARYLEPFTGEGIAWAIESAMRVQPYADRAIERWQPDLLNLWSRELHHFLRRRQRACYAMKFFAAHPTAVRWSIPLLRRLPWLARPVIHAIHGPA